MTSNRISPEKKLELYTQLQHNGRATIYKNDSFGHLTSKNRPDKRYQNCCVFLLKLRTNALQIITLKNLFGILIKNSFVWLLIFDAHPPTTRAS